MPNVGLSRAGEAARDAGDRRRRMTPFTPPRPRLANVSAGTFVTPVAGPAPFLPPPSNLARRRRRSPRFAPLQRWARRVNGHADKGQGMNWSAIMHPDSWRPTTSNLVNVCYASHVSRVDPHSYSSSTKSRLLQAQGGDSDSSLWLCTRHNSAISDMRDLKRIAR
ncbi:hypothetical protein BV20DRAFT_113004 [Pilatotrama ljubarskyi]|nr:hypothetical protein BV20DRAFT_113004 [Pilatotrama ljubarskyi]